MKRKDIMMAQVLERLGKKKLGRNSMISLRRRIFSPTLYSESDFDFFTHPDVINLQGLDETVLQQNNVVRPASLVKEWHREKIVGFDGMGSFFEELLSSSAISDKITEYLKIPPGAPTPGELYAEVAPTVIQASKDYRQVSPAIDWLASNWQATLVTLMIIGVSSSVIGGLIVKAITKKKR